MTAVLKQNLKHTSTISLHLSTTCFRTIHSPPVWLYNPHIFSFSEYVTRPLYYKYWIFCSDEGGNIILIRTYFLRLFPLRTKRCVNWKVPVWPKNIELVLQISTWTWFLLIRGRSSTCFKESQWDKKRYIPKYRYIEALLTDMGNRMSL